MIKIPQLLFSFLFFLSWTSPISQSNPLWYLKWPPPSQSQQIHDPSEQLDKVFLQNLIC